MLDNVSPPKSPCDAMAVEVIAPPLVTMAEDEASHLRAQLVAIQEAMARSEREAAASVASHAEAQAHLLGKFPTRFPVHPSKDVLL